MRALMRSGYFAAGRPDSGAIASLLRAAFHATLRHAAFSRRGWLFEPKLDGVRCLALRSGGDIQLLSRNQKRLNEKYPELVEAFRGQPSDAFAVDGEIVTFEGAVTSFAKLQQRMQLQRPPEELRRRIPIWYYAFDLLHLKGKDTRQLTLRERKARRRRCEGSETHLLEINCRSGVPWIRQDKTS